MWFSKEYCAIHVDYNIFNIGKINLNYSATILNIFGSVKSIQMNIF